MSTEAGHKTTATLSRSTSAGSSSDEGLDKSLSYPSSGGSCGYLPDYDYPTPLIVRNTFIDTPLDRTVSLDEYLQERRIQSAPVETLLAVVDEPSEIPSAAHRLHLAATAGAAALSAAVTDTASAMKGWWRPFGADAEAVSIPETCTVIHTPVMSPAAAYTSVAPPVLLLSEVIEAPPLASQMVLGSPDMPTMGSAGHWIGDCKPCAFYHKRGCTNGVHCTFCHICDSGEKKRRQKEKVQQLKLEREMARQGMSL